MFYFKQISSYVCIKSCSTLCNPVDYSPPGSSLHGILQATTLEWVACPPPRDLPNPGIEPTSLMSPALAGEFLTTSTTWEAVKLPYDPALPLPGIYPREMKTKTCPQKNMHRNVHNNIIHGSQKVEQLKCSSPDGCINKMQGTHIREY